MTTMKYVEINHTYAHETHSVVPSILDETEHNTFVAYCLWLQIRLEGDVRFRLTEETKIRDEARQAAEKKIEQLQIESVAQESARQRLEQDMVRLRMDLQRAEQEAKEERGRTEADSRVLKNR